MYEWESSKGHEIIEWSEYTKRDRSIVQKYKIVLILFFIEVRQTDEKKWKKKEEHEGREESYFWKEHPMKNRSIYEIERESCSTKRYIVFISHMHREMKNKKERETDDRVKEIFEWEKCKYYDRAIGNNKTGISRKDFISTKEWNVGKYFKEKYSKKCYFCSKKSVGMESEEKITPCWDERHDCREKRKIEITLVDILRFNLSKIP